MFKQACFLIATWAAASAVGLAQDSYEPPTPPIPLPPSAPSFAPLDIEVDKFVRIPQARQRFNVDGAGLAVVVIDTGLNPQHLSFAGRIIPGRNFSTEGNPTDTTDRQGHGSNVAGIIVGGELTPDIGLPPGIAPQANVIPLKVFPGGQFEKINEALEWVINNREPIRNDRHVLISVVNLSLGNQTNASSLNAAALPPSLRRQQQLIQQLRELGVVVTVAAGNDYSSVDPEEGMGFPAICPETTSVGAVFDTDFPRRSDGQPLVEYMGGASVFEAHAGRLTVFTQRLSGVKGGVFRTDIFAPGFIVTSAGPVPPNGSTEDPSRTRTTQDGTSQATPVVAGIVLLLQHHYRNLMEQMGEELSLPPVDLVERCLRDGGVGITDLEDEIGTKMDNVTSCGAQDLIRVDAVSALTYLSEQLQNDLQNLQFEMLRANNAELQEQVLERSTILGKSAKE